MAQWHAQTAAHPHCISFHRIKDASVPVGGKKMRVDDAEFLIQEKMKQPAAHAANFKKAMATGDRCDGAPPCDGEPH